jgi:hypothetical protein
LYGGHCLIDLFTLNLAAPMLSFVKQTNKKGVQVVVRFHVKIFNSIASIYGDAITTQ